MEEQRTKIYHQRETLAWAEKISRKFNVSDETVLGIYDEMYRKNRLYAKERAVSFIALYLDGKEHKYEA